MHPLVQVEYPSGPKVQAVTVIHPQKVRSSYDIELPVIYISLTSLLITVSYENYWHIRGWVESASPTLIPSSAALYPSPETTP